MSPSPDRIRETPGNKYIGINDTPCVRFPSIRRKSDTEYPNSHAVHSFTTRMHGRVREERRARRKGEGHTDSEDTEPEENKGEMDNFQDLQLGSITPLVCHKVGLS